MWEAGQGGGNVPLVKRCIRGEGVEAAAPHICDLVHQHVTHGAQLAFVTFLAQDAGGGIAAPVAKGRKVHFDEHGIIDAVETATDVYLRERSEGERFLDTYRRVGMAPFKEALYG